MFLSRLKFKKYFSKKDVDDIIQVYLSLTHNYQLGAIEHVVSDEDDNYLFALCKISKASYLVTGDKLLQAEEFYHTTSIVTLTVLRALLHP